uniref:Uncharacterized protein n=1 Tax=Setaria viridis TaxID=4556 RepID=A0A4U6W1U1_SETVI|nr:hypothetical protein SEVIR_2G307650v2 [Setaria viridis]
MTAASQDRVILPSSPPKPNSSCDIRRSSAKTAVLRHANGTSNRTPSVVYTTQWPLLATEVQHSSASIAAARQLESCGFSLLCFVCEAASDGVQRPPDRGYIVHSTARAEWLGKGQGHEHGQCDVGRHDVLSVLGFGHHACSCHGEGCKDPILVGGPT